MEFLDTTGDMEKYSVKAIGSRPKTVNETSLNGIYFRETPSVIFTENIEEQDSALGYRYIKVSDIESMFSISSQGKSAKERLDELIYAHGYCIDSASITTLPIYYLDVNTRIYIHNNDSNIDGTIDVIIVKNHIYELLQNEVV